MRPETVSIALMAPIGFGLGVAYFAAVRRTAALLASRGAARLPVIAFTVGRGAAAVGVLGFAASLGAGALLSAFSGFLLARAVALRVARRAR